VALIKNRYGKGRVRVMRIHRDGDRHEVSQLSVKAMIEGDFARAYTHADNSTSVATDTIKNIVNIVARENTGLSTEEFCQVLAKRYLDALSADCLGWITAHETKWSRLSFRRQAASPQFCARQQRQAVRRGRRHARGGRRH
jgi:urate oxidase